MTEKRQAIFDAITAAIVARQTTDLSAGGGLSNVDIDVDPDLLKPKDNAKTTGNANVSVKDPDHVLDNKNTDDENDDGSEQSNGINKSNDSDKSERGSGNKEDQDGDNSGSESNGGTADDEKESSGKGASKSGDDEQEQENQNGGKEGNSKESKNSQNENDIDPAYVNSWNEIMSRFDTEAVSDQDIKKLISDIRSGKINSL